MVPEYVIADIFKDHGIRYVADNEIPQELKEKGWMTQTFEKECDDGEVAVVHVIFGPNENGEQVCLRDEKMSIRFVEFKNDEGKMERRITDVNVIQKEPNDKHPCKELFEALESKYNTAT